MHRARARITSGIARPDVPQIWVVRLREIAGVARATLRISRLSPSRSHRADGMRKAEVVLARAQSGENFLPLSLRPVPQAAPRASVRRPARVWLRIAAVTAIFIGVGVFLAGWRLEAVEATGCAGLPPSAKLNLEDLRGRWIPALDLDQIRQDFERWPGVAEVTVELQLPETLRVRAIPDEICASIPTGRAWRGITCDGVLSRHLGRPKLPLLLGFDGGEGDFQSALSIGNRLSDDTIGHLLSIRKVTPLDYELTIRLGVPPRTTSIIRVLPQGSRSEQWWRTAAFSGQAPAWADLRFDRQVVIRRLG